MRNELKPFEIMPPEVQAMILQAADAKVASIIEGKSGLKEIAQILIERLAGDSKYLLQAYNAQIEPDDLRNENINHELKVEGLKGEATEKAKTAIAENVLVDPEKLLPRLNTEYVNSQYSTAQIEKMAVIVKLIGSSKIDYGLVKNNNEEEQGSAAAKTLGASLARGITIPESDAKNILPKKQKEEKTGIG